MFLHRKFNYNVYMSFFIATIATNFIIFRYALKPKYRPEKDAALKAS